MHYATEDLSPVKKKITVTVPVEEVEASLAATIAMYRTSITLDGFRKGKVPASLIEKRFHKEVYKEATTDLVNVHINDIITEAKLSPVSRIDFDGGELERGQEFVYSISFEVMPEFDLPPYEGLEVEQEEAVVNEDEITALVERVRLNMAEIVTVGEARTPCDGEIVVIDFEAFDEQNAPIPGISAENFQLQLGDGQTLDDFESLVKSLKPGEESTGPVRFPEDFFNTEFAGRTVSMKAKLHAIKERKLPELDDAFAQKAGGLENMDKLYASLRDSYVNSRTELNKSAAQATLLDNLLKMVDFPAPDSMLEGNISMMLGELQDKLERQGKNLAALGKTQEALREEVRPEAEMRAKSHILLLGVARAEELTVSEAEVDLQLGRIATQNKQEYSAIKEYYTRNNLLFALRDRLLADKAMDAIYSKAEVKIVPAKQSEENADDSEAAGKKQEDAPDASDAPADAGRDGA